MINLLDNTRNQPTNFRSSNWFDVNDDAHEIYNNNSKIRFSTSRLKSSLYVYCDVYILASVNIAVLNTGTAAKPNKRKNITIKNCTPFTDCIREINNAQIGNAKDIDAVMAMYHLIEYSDNYSKTFG